MVTNIPSVHEIREMLRTNDRAVARALVALRERQTEDEKATQHTRHENGRGFRPAHARMGTSMAEFYLRNGYLTVRQVAYWRKPMKDGKSRIEIYARQLVEVARERAETQAAMAQAAMRQHGEHAHA